MATIKKINISRNWATRPTDNAIYDGIAWGVQKGERYDLVQFSLEEIDKPFFWRTALAFPLGMSEEEIRNECIDYVKNNITDKDIKEFLWFLECGEKWGWD